MVLHDANFSERFLDQSEVDASLDQPLNDEYWASDTKVAGSNSRQPQEFDRPLDFHWTSDRAALDRTGWQPTGNKLYDRCVRSILTAVALAGQAADEGWVSYSRRREWYTGKQRYQGLPYSYLRIRRAVDELCSKGLIEEIRARSGDHRRTGRQSRIRATSCLLNAFAGATFEYAAVEIIRLRDGDGNLMEYRETLQTGRMRAELEKINSGLAAHTLTLPEQCIPVGKHHVGVGRSIIRTTPVVSLYRVFNRGCWSKGGRLYWWGQSLPSDVRTKILIDGEAAVEEDFTGMHLRIAHALAGSPMPTDHDPYAVTDVKRAYAKFALLIAINARSRAETIGALIAKIEAKFGVELTRAKAASILDAVIANNPTIRSYICSDAGIDFMNIDSRIAVRVVKACLVAGFPAFPIHDSFIAPASRKAELRSIMDREMEAFEASKATANKS